MVKQGKQWETLFWGAPKSLQMVTPAKKLKYLLLGRKTLTNLDSILKSRDITLLTKVYVVKVMVSPVVRYRCESWTIKKAKCRRTDAFELWCWRRLLRVFWSTRRSNQSILKKISPENSLEGQMLKLKRQYFGQLMWRTDCLEAGKDWRQQEKGMAEDEMAGRELVMDRETWHAAVHGVTKSLTRLSNWSELNWILILQWTVYLKTPPPPEKWQIKEFGIIQIFLLNMLLCLPSSL